MADIQKEIPRSDFPTGLAAVGDHWIAAEQKLVAVRIVVVVGIQHGG